MAEWQTLDREYSVSRETTRIIAQSKDSMRLTGMSPRNSLMLKRQWLSSLPFGACPSVDNALAMRCAYILIRNVGSSNVVCVVVLPRMPIRQ